MVSGLGRFKEDLAVEGPSFSYELAFRDLGRTLDRIERIYRAGAMEWAAESRRDLMDRFRSARRAVDAAFEREDHRAVDGALRSWAAVVREIVEGFDASVETVPEIQVDQVEPSTGSLFDGPDQARARSHRGAL